MKLKEHLQIFARGVKYAFALEKRHTTLVILDTFLSSITGYIPIYFSAKIIDALAEGAPMKTAVLYVVLTVGLVFLLKLLNTYVSLAKDISSGMLWRAEDWSYSKKAMDMAYESIEDPEVARLRYRVRRENQTGQNLWRLYRSIEGLVRDLTKITASLALTASFFALPSIPLLWKLAIPAGMLLVLVTQIFTTGKTAKLERKFQEDSVDMNILSEQFYDYIQHYGAGKDIRLYHMGDFLADSYVALDRKYWEGHLRLAYKNALWGIPATILNHALKLGLYAVLIYAALQGGVSVGSIAKYVSCLMILAGTFSGTVRNIQLTFDNNHYLKRYFSYFDIPNKMYKGSLTVEKREDNEYTVEFRNVSFKYPGAEVYALQNVNLKFKIGEKLAIVGMNGSGKTTFIKLLCRLYDPTEGEILLNGVNIQKYDYDEYMSVFSVVFQDFTLFSFKLGEVVACGKDFDEEKVKECLIKANFGDRLATLPDGVHTYLYKHYSENGVEISGGEAQKIALARALYKDAPFILLDEPTAALDPISEYRVYSNFNAISGDKTAVYISHRLASCRFCDMIAVFDGGKIVQTGDHESLLADTQGKYHSLWHAQAQYYKE